MKRRDAGVHVVCAKRGWLPLAIWAAFTLALFVVQVPFRGVRDAGSALAVGVALLPAAAALAASARRYYRVAITPTALRAGRSSIPLAEIDDAVLRFQLDHGYLVPGGPNPAGGTIAAPLVGGAFDAPLGWHKVALRRLDGSWFAVGVPDPSELLHALAGRCGGAPPRPAPQ